MFSGLPSALEARLKFTFPCGDDEDADVGLGRAAYHVRNVCLVPRGIQDGPPPVLRLEVGTPDLHSLALCLLLLVGVHDVGKEPTLAILILGLLHVLLNRSLIDAPAEIQNVSTGCRLASVDVADENHVQVGPGVRLGKDLLAVVHRCYCLLLHHLLLLLHGLWRRGGRRGRGGRLLRRQLLRRRLLRRRLRLGLLHHLGLLGRGRLDLLQRRRRLLLLGLVLPIVDGVSVRLRPGAAARGLGFGGGLCSSGNVSCGRLLCSRRPLLYPHGRSS
mmetsp:Transcript_79519/g.224893  ORF Transcript_79519/g.224893 Transcript_79519/m.224893 type:complete len:274 (-) Transcript_79519:212-1033(-)